jgi:hypothetical protein
MAKAAAKSPVDSILEAPPAAVEEAAPAAPEATEVTRWEALLAALPAAPVAEETTLEAEDRTLAMAVEAEAATDL